MLRSYFYKLLHSPLFFIGFFATIALCFFSLDERSTHNCIVHNLDSLISFESYRKVFVLFAALPFVCNFSDEWNSKTIVNCITRRDVYNYAVSNVVMCFISAFTVIFAGLMIYVFFQIALQIPLYSPYNLSKPYDSLMLNGSGLLALTIIVFVYASSCAMWAVMGLAASAFFPSKYVAICAPFVFCYIVERFTKYFPEWLRLGPLSKSWSGLNPLPAFLNAVSVFLGISIICGVIFALKVRRRVENELS